MKTTSRDATESGRGKPNIDFDKNNFFVFLFEKKKNILLDSKKILSFAF